jgi:hypothetical protein
MDDHSVILKSLRNKILGTPAGASEVESDILTSQEEEKLLASPEEELLGSPEEEMELLESGEELPEFNAVEDLREWLGLSMDDMTTSEEIPEFNIAEDFRQWLEL